MKYAVHDKKYHFRYFFDSETGFYMRTGILDDQGKDTGIDPFMASFPHLMMWESWGTVFMAKVVYARQPACSAIKAAILYRNRICV